MQIVRFYFPASVFIESLDICQNHHGSQGHFISVQRCFGWVMDRSPWLTTVVCWLYGKENIHLLSGMCKESLVIEIGKPTASFSSP